MLLLCFSSKQRRGNEGTSLRFVSLLKYPKNPYETYSNTLRNNSPRQKNPKLYPTHTPLTPLQKLFLLSKSALEASSDPKNAHAVAATLDITSTFGLEMLKKKKLNTKEGQRILREKPRLNDISESRFSSLSKLPSNTFGYHYSKFMHAHGFDHTSRPPVKYVDDPESAYILLRYRESHDYYHTLFNLPPTVLGEIILKYIETLEFKLGGTALQAVLGTLVNLDEKERSVVLGVLQEISEGREGECLLSVFWEEEFENDIEEVRRRLGVKAFEDDSFKID